MWQMMKLYNKEGAETFLDTRGKALRAGTRAKPTAEKPNSVELEELFNEQVQGVHYMAVKGKPCWIAACRMFLYPSAPTA